MFYSQFILAKKGPLGTIWIAAHLERKLRKNQVADTDIGVSVDSILFPEVPIALRLSSHLLLGVVRIYSRKVNYLFDDCSETLLKIKQAFRSTAVDLPPEQSKAPYHSITLPETFDLDDFEIPDDEILKGNFVDHHVSTREQITLQDTMDGVAFPTSQFGPDERFGDGDASQIGLDLDEELFLDKGDAAGTSGGLMDMDADPQLSVKASSPSKGDDNDEGVSDPSLASPADNFSIQAPSTPGLLEEPNLPSAQEALVSDDHMDEDHNPSEFAAKEVSGPPSSPSGPPNFEYVDFHANGNCHHQDDQKKDDAMPFEVEFTTETTEHNATGVAESLTSKQVEAINGQEITGNAVDGSSFESKRNMVNNNEHAEADEVGMTEVSTPLPVFASMAELNGCEVGADNADVDDTYQVTSDIKSENNNLSVGSEVPSSGKSEQTVVTIGSEVPDLGKSEQTVASIGSSPHNEVQPCTNPAVPEMCDANIDKRLSVPSMPVLQACNSHVQHACNGFDSLVGASHIPAQGDGLCSLRTSAREDSTNFSSVSTEVQGAVKTSLNVEQITNEITDADNIYLDGKLVNKIAEGNIVEKENEFTISELPAPEKLLSVPDFPAVQPAELFAENTPAKDDLMEGEGDGVMDTILSGRKRSYTESTLTIQSLNSADSSGAAQSKRSADLVPDDDDLLSSILAGRKSTALKMKPTPPVTDTVRAKRQRVSVRASAHKRKVLVDDAMVLHGDTIREQLTNTEDIRRVRKKAPCTRVEIWMLQKQFLEDELFSEHVFTGMSAALISLHSETIDLSRIRIVEQDVHKGSNEVDTTARPIPAEEAENVGMFTPSATRDDGERNQGDSLKIPGHQESILSLDDSALHKEMRTVNDEVTKEGSEYCISDKMADKELDDGRVLVDSEAMGSEQATADHPVYEVNHDTEAEAVDAANLNKIGDIDTAHFSITCQLPDERCDMQSTVEVASIAEITGEAKLWDQEGVDATERHDLGEEYAAKCLLEGKGADIDSDGYFRDHCPLPVHDGSVIDSVPLEGGACPSSEQIMDGYQLDESVPVDHRSSRIHDETLSSNKAQDINGLNSDNFVSEGLKLDSSCSVDAGLSCQNATTTENENQECLDREPKIFVDSTTNDMDHIYSGEHDEIGTDAIEHDTDFLNVDDDDVAEDYENDMPNNEEKRILDNTGWSARTRAVANYLQVLFEKETQRGKRDISLDSLLVGKTRKEASRMFFETLVLKTKDYIHAEQESSFCDIRIMPRGKLLKSDF